MNSSKGPTISCVIILWILSNCWAKVYFTDTFDDVDWENRWVQSQHNENYGLFKLSSGNFFGNKEANQGIQTSQDARFYALSAKFAPFSNKDSSLVIQYSVKNNIDLECGGTYLKLLDCSVDQKEFHGESPYLIMFGPDKCGSSKVLHAIIHYKGKNVARTSRIPHSPDVFTHLYTLIINPDSTYEVLVDNESIAEGNLEDDWELLPPKKIKDPAQKKPDDWEDQEYIEDPDDIKPEDWDKSMYIPDPDSKKPSDWDEEMDGEWEPNQIDNPEYKGEWKPKKITNPKYKGKWIHPEIYNPEYTADPDLYVQKEVCGIGFDLWQVQSGTVFDNILITDDKEFARERGEQQWKAYVKAEKEMKKELDEEERSKVVVREDDDEEAMEDENEESEDYDNEGYAEGENEDAEDYPEDQEDGENQEYEEVSGQEDEMGDAAKDDDKGKGKENQDESNYEKRDEL